MAQENDIAWTPILYCAGAGLAGLALGTFLIAPMIQKMKSKKQAEEKKKAITNTAKK